jgi:hypothetical protein
MPARGQWIINPDTGGKKIPKTVKRDIEKRIHAVANEQFSRRYKRQEIHFRGQFCYIDAFIEPHLSENWPPPNWPETREEYLERMRNATPLSISDGYVIMAMINGVLPFIPTA